jgi:hypothetical protein
VASVAAMTAAFPPKAFIGEFPDYAAPSHPQPLIVKDIHDLLSNDEALVLFASGDKES